MNAFGYIAVDAWGNSVQGTVDATDWNAARKELSARGLRDVRPAENAPPNNHPTDDAPPPSDVIHDARPSMPKLSPDQAIELANHLAALARSELPLADGARAVSRELPSSELSAALAVLAARLEAGESLETALETIGKRMPAHIRELMIAGARSGRLADTLDALIAHERAVSDLGTRLWQAIAYPMALLTILIAWLLLMSLWIVPQMEEASLLADVDDVGGTMFAYSWSTEDPTPATPTYESTLTDFAYLTPRILLFVLGAVLVTVIGAWLIGGAARVSLVWRSLPILGPAIWYRSLIDFCGLLTVFLNEQLPLGKAMQLTSTAARDPAIRAAVRRAASDTNTGRELAAAMRSESVFPATLVNLVEWGEHNDRLVDSVAGAGRMFRHRFESQMRLVRLVVPPIALLTVSGCALLVMFGWYRSIGTAIRLLY